MLVWVKTEKETTMVQQIAFISSRFGRDLPQPFAVASLAAYLIRRYPPVATDSLD